ncbi:MAG: MGMT family protein [Candidatus Peribacteria bacterium]|nr:MGMT family protein [Candidatus Peribacteria bacterium]
MKLSAAQLLVYEALLKIPKGKVITYATLGKYI